MADIHAVGGRPVAVPSRTTSEPARAPSGAAAAPAVGQVSEFVLPNQLLHMTPDRADAPTAEPALDPLRAERIADPNAASQYFGSHPSPGRLKDRQGEGASVPRRAAPPVRLALDRRVRLGLAVAGLLLLVLALLRLR